ncbi:MAG: glycosyltransferase family 87 protein [Bryobacteraceae bacterium]
MRTLPFPKPAIGLLFLVALLFFLFRGPYRAVRSITPRDFALVYTAARCWMKGDNPYDPSNLSHEFLYVAKGPPALVPEPKSHPSVYAPMAMPLIAALAWLPWAKANLLWCLLSTALFAMSLLLIFRSTDLSIDGKWLLASVLVAFSPTHTGLAMGNPSMIVCSSIALAIYFALVKRWLLSGILLGVAHCLKPQLSICALAVLGIWKYWSPVLISLLVPVVSTGMSVITAPSLSQYWQWCLKLQQNITGSFALGGTNNPSAGQEGSFILLNSQAIVGLFTPNLLLNDAIVWIMGGMIVALYFGFKTKDHHVSRWRDLAFFSALTIAITYHRYYDAQLLLLLIPFMLESWHAYTAIVIALGACLLLLAFPSQATFAVWRGSGQPSSVLGLVLFRHQPLAVLAMSLLLIPWPVKSWPASLLTHRSTAMN